MLHYEKRLAERKQCGNFRELQVTHSIVDFASNDYLGLSKAPRFAASVFCEWKKCGQRGIGSTGSRLLTGNSQYAQELEERIARLHGYEAGVLFNCGYMANVGLISAVANEKSVIFFDAAVHASIRDGVRLSRATSFPFKHNDVQHLESRLNSCVERGDRFIFVESIYSTDGSTAPLSQICQAAKKYNAHVIVDEAHAVGIWGPRGLGKVAESCLHEEVFAQVVTFGKALGAHGAIVLGTHSLKQALINFARPLVYTTALPFSTLAAIKCSYDLFPKMEEERQQIQKLIRIYGDMRPHSSMTHIQSIIIRGNEAAKNVASRVSKRGFDVRALLSPTVQRGQEQLRISLHAFNDENELVRLLSILKECHA